MSQLLNLALEDDESHKRDQQIVFNGPLADVFTKALQQAYPQGQVAEPEPGATEPAAAAPAAPEGGEQALAVVLESQQMAHAAVTTLAKMLANPQMSGQAQTTNVFGVSRNDLSAGVVVDVAKHVSGAQDAPKPGQGDWVVIVDATMPGSSGQGSGEPEEKMIEINTAIESFVKAAGGKFFTSLKSFAESL